MRKGTTSNGFNFKISDEALDDWELVETLDELEENPQRMVKVAKILLGTEQLNALKESCKENGRVSLKKMTSEITDILNSSKETKN